MSTSKIALGLFGTEMLFGGDLKANVEIAKQADQKGIDQVVLVDHVVMGERTDRYPFGDFPVPPEYPWLEPMTLLSVIAGCTEQVRLSTSIMISPLRSAVLLAKSAATLDVLSDGRLDLGVGTGWQREEYEASGIPFKGRMQRMDEQLTACRKLWEGGPTTYQAETVQLERVWSEPKPAQQRLPLWFGVKPDATNAERIARLGDGWIPISTRLDFIRPGIECIQEAFVAAGRDPSELMVRARPEIVYTPQGNIDLDATLSSADAMRAAGITHLEFFLTSLIQDPNQVDSFIDTISTL